MNFFFNNPHIQTLYATFYVKPKLPFLQTERFELEDGDFVDCVWHKKPSLKDESPIVVLFHGLTGSIASPYILRTMYRLGEEGFSVVLMHFRGCSGEINRLPRSYHSGETGDARAWIKHLRESFALAPLFGVGFSLGGNMLLKLMGEFHEESLLDGAVAISAPMDLKLCADRIDQGFSKFYQRHLMQPLLRQLLQKYEMFDMESLIGLKRDEVYKLKTFWEFDDAYTAPVHGFRSAVDYYEKSSARYYMKDIIKPTLIIHAEDDPFTGKDVIPSQEELSSAVTLELHKNGGHIGFIGGSFIKPEFWLYDRIVDYITTLSKEPSRVR
jgi:predicted alpha/beta-fold hydrolase